MRVQIDLKRVDGLTIVSKSVELGLACTRRRWPDLVCDPGEWSYSPKFKPLRLIDCILPIGASHLFALSIVLCLLGAAHL